jgi:Bardet-Biedl syndrome 5 protein
MLFNVSLPWVQIENIKIRESKFGKALVIVSSPSSSKYTLGFRIDPEEKLRSVGKEIIQLLKAHSSQPELGVFEEIATKSDIPISFDEDVAVEKTKTDSSLLYALEQSSEPSEPILDPSCGLLVEKMPPGVTLKSLWAL